MIIQRTRAYRYEEEVDSFVRESALRAPSATRLGYDRLLLASVLQETLDGAGLRALCRRCRICKVDALLLGELTPAQLRLLDQLGATSCLWPSEGKALTVASEDDVRLVLQGGALYVTAKAGESDLFPAAAHLRSIPHRLTPASSYARQVLQDLVRGASSLGPEGNVTGRVLGRYGLPWPGQGARERGPLNYSDSLLALSPRGEELHARLITAFIPEWR